MERWVCADQGITVAMSRISTCTRPSASLTEAEDLELGRLV